jgi:hypothetical protein
MEKCGAFDRNEFNAWKQALDKDSGVVLLNDKYPKISASFVIWHGNKGTLATGTTRPPDMDFWLEL